MSHRDKGAFAKASPPERVLLLVTQTCLGRNFGQTVDVDKRHLTPANYRHLSISKSSSRRVKMPSTSRIPYSSPWLAIRSVTEGEGSSTINPPHLGTTTSNEQINTSATFHAVPLPSGPPLVPKPLPIDARILPKTRASQSTVTPKSSPFISTHIGAPCSVAALDHILQCGHKVVTPQPEECARNCDQPVKPHITVNERRMDEPFVCMVCITKEVAAALASKSWSFREELQIVARETGRQQPGMWIKNKITILQMAWRDQAVQEIEMRRREGRVARAFYIDPEIEELVEEALRRRASPSIEDLCRAEDETLSDASATESKDEQTQISVLASPASSTTSISTPGSKSRIPVRKR